MLKKNTNKIVYTDTGSEGLKQTCVLQDKLVNYHKELSPSYFYKWYAGMPPGEQRNRELIEKFVNGLIRVDLARDENTRELVGYCISTISVKKEGEITSIYVEPNYRKLNIGDTMMKKALRWMDENSVVKKVLEVGAGNEDVLDYYQRFHFYPRSTILEQIDIEKVD